jgi:excisionase family DNA binding protein
MPPKDWLSSAEVAELIGVSRQTVTQMIRDGRLPARAIESGSRVIYRVRREALAEWARRHTRDLG